MESALGTGLNNLDRQFSALQGPHMGISGEMCELCVKWAWQHLVRGLLFRVFPPLKLPVTRKILKSMDGETPNQIGCYSELL